MIKRLRKRFIRIAMLSVTIVLVLLSLIVNIANFASTDSDLTHMLMIISENRGTIPMRTPFGDDRKDGGKPDKNTNLTDNLINQETPYSTRYFCLHFDEDGNLDEADLGHIAAITENETDEYVAVALKHGEGFGYYSHYKYNVVSQGDGLYMATFLDCYQEMRAVRIVAICSLLADIVCILLVYILVVIFSKKAIAPVARSAEQQKQFITDAGHELKTPITVIATSLKLLEMETGKQKWLDKAMTQTEKLKDLVNSLVTLSRMDEEESPLHFQKFPISDAVTETAESFLDFARSNGHELTISIEPGLTYNGDEYAVRRLVTVLLDNAVKYASENSEIYLSLTKTRKGVVLRSGNDCDETIAPEELNKLFDRFYRADKSRNASTGGFGIGLSIARSIAEGHKGSIRAISPEPHKIEFEVELK